MRKRKKTGSAPYADFRKVTSLARFAFPAFVAVAILILAAAPRLAAKQKPAPVKTIAGEVLNSRNTGVAGATVTLTNVETHHTVALYSGANGMYSFSGLDPNDDYQVQARYQGSSSDVRHVSSLDSRVKVVINLVLGSPGTASAE